MYVHIFPPLPVRRSSLTYIQLLTSCAALLLYSYVLTAWVYAASTFMSLLMPSSQPRRVEIYLGSQSLARPSKSSLRNSRHWRFSARLLTDKQVDSLFSAPLGGDPLGLLGVSCVYWVELLWQYLTYPPQDVNEAQIPLFYFILTKSTAVLWARSADGWQSYVHFHPIITHAWYTFRSTLLPLIASPYITDNSGPTYWLDNKQQWSSSCEYGSCTIYPEYSRSWLRYFSCPA